MVKNISILIISCKKYHIFSPICLYFIKKNIIPYEHFDIYYSNDVFEINDKIVKKNIVTKNIDSSNFVSRLYESIKIIESEYIWLIQEDHWYTQPKFDKDTISNIEIICKKWNLDQLRIDDITLTGEKTYQNDVLYCDDKISVLWCRGTSYPITHHGTIFKKTYLMENLNEALNNNKLSPWQHEIFNCKEAHKIKQKHDDSNPLRIAYVNYRKNNNYIHAVNKGKLLKEGKKTINENLNETVFKDLITILPSTSFL